MMYFIFPFFYRIFSNVYVSKRTVFARISFEPIITKTPLLGLGSPCSLIRGNNFE